eukprot:CAMPEP_0201566734 /NCGR_PEP_ID=MMETSP0190_2-20130828/6749_1 /ASSEMBLY_ACC=CAM_ASM_000263 /TAXON_ID=37353 /ORGANISM="Rosalina sp." /LENGTH=299 /DNA_ID=CAMNT_0047985859 /DNA_START=13 /DNA_END=909 /DNA_ORIENTATION=+
MADSNSGHVAATTAFKAVTTTGELDGENDESGVHHVNLVFIALIVGSLACVLIMCIYMLFRKRKCPCCQKKEVIDRGDSVVVEEINVQPWKIKIGPAATPVSSPSFINEDINHQHMQQMQQNIRHTADSSGDSVAQLWSKSDNENDNGNETDDDDMYLQPKMSIASGSYHGSHHGSHASRDSHLSVHSIDLSGHNGHNNHNNGHQKKISISANNFAIETNEMPINDELIEGSEYETSQQNNWPIVIKKNSYNNDDEKRGSVDDDNMDGRHMRNLTGADELENDYTWIEMAFRQIDDKDW